MYILLTTFCCLITSTIVRTPYSSDIKSQFGAEIMVGFDILARARLGSDLFLNSLQVNYSNPGMQPRADYCPKSTAERELITGQN